MPYIAPYRSQLRPYNHAYAYRGLTAFATLSMAVSDGSFPHPTFLVNKRYSPHALSCSSH
ncbi:MAG: hypothetical protein ABW170_01705 [Candidatus Thiodiazotropha sp. L084R]